MRRYSTNDIGPAEPIPGGGYRGPVLLVRRPFEWLLTQVNMSLLTFVSLAQLMLREYRTPEPPMIVIFNLSRSGGSGNAIWNVKDWPWRM